ncbi:MAG: 2-succinyl-6-hydroxy-2,4-cyclohexadiene-1-carboxylate synthase [Actinomycetota bacterium]|nr:2-succinyl-6-hydroxy-2,4-cyclohexadiene-1-carboxylate synthase [Actinomycetota bacterium]
MNTTLFAEVTGTGPPLLTLHGFTGDRGSLAPMTGSLSERHTIIAVDLPGHGRTGVVEQVSEYRFENTIDAVAAVLSRLGHERVDVLGYSMGGRLALGLAIQHPERVQRSVLVSASAGVADNAQRTARRRADDQLAEELLERGIEWFVNYWMGLPMFASQDRLHPDILEASRRQRLENDPRGLARSLRGVGSGNQPPLWRRLDEVAGPVLIVVGEEDTQFRSLGVRMATGLRDAAIAVIPEAGHACHLENPEATTTAVSNFLSG